MVSQEREKNNGKDEDPDMSLPDLYCSEIQGGFFPPMEESSEESS